MSIFFVTGTDTCVGKTIASRGIIQAFQQVGEQIVGYKPIAPGQNEPVYTDILDVDTSDYGQEDNHDVLVLMNSTHESVTYRDINSYTFSHTVPMLTQESERINLDKIDTDLNRLKSTYANVLVEGAFGWLTPMNKSLTFGDWVVQHKMPVVLVVGIKEGCVNHALLTAKTIESMGLSLVGWIANRINPGLSHYAEIIEVLKNKINAPLLGKIPYIHKPENQDVGQYITGISHLQSL